MAAKVGEPISDEERCVRKWRRERMVAAGYPRKIADQLASDNDVDLHKAVELVENGCPPHLALRILGS